MAPTTKKWNFAFLLKIFIHISFWLPETPKKWYKYMYMCMFMRQIRSPLPYAATREKLRGLLLNKTLTVHEQFSKLCAIFCCFITLLCLVDFLECLHSLEALGIFIFYAIIEKVWTSKTAAASNSVSEMSLCQINVSLYVHRGLRAPWLVFKWKCNYLLLCIYRRKMYIKIRN